MINLLYHECFFLEERKKNTSKRWKERWDII